MRPRPYPAATQVLSAAACSPLHQSLDDLSDAQWKLLLKQLRILLQLTAHPLSRQRVLGALRRWPNSPNSAAPSPAIAAAVVVEGLGRMGAPLRASEAELLQAWASLVGEADGSPVFDAKSWVVVSTLSSTGLHVALLVYEPNGRRRARVVRQVPSGLDCAGLVELASSTALAVGAPSARIEVDRNCAWLKLHGPHPALSPVLGCFTSESKALLKHQAMV